MSVKQDFIARVSDLKVSDAELYSYFKNTAAIKHRVPVEEEAFPQMVVEVDFTTSTSGKGGYNESTTLYMSIWFEDGIDESTDADRVAKYLMDKLDNTRIQNGTFVKSVGRQTIVEPKSSKARVRIQFNLKSL